MHKDLNDTRTGSGASYHSRGEVETSSGTTHPFISLVGQPNSGKTTLFNVLTGSNFKTSNYPGATVEYSVGMLNFDHSFEAYVLDSPGIISLSPGSPDEEVTINALFNHPRFGLPDVVVVTADATQLSRQLFLVKQLIDAGFKVVTALTMNDLLEKKNLSVDAEKLERIIGAPVIKIDARKEAGIEKLIETIHLLYLASLEPEYKKKIRKPEMPTVETISGLYSFTEETERKVLFRIDQSQKLEQVNKKAFGVFTRTPDENTLKLDKIFLHPFWGIIIFIISMGIIFTSIFWVARPLMDLIDYLFSSLSGGVASVLPQSTWYNDLITNGLINGVGAVMVFLPQIVILFLFLGILEDTGYLARAAMLIDKPLSKFGLNGRSFVPMISGYACAIPAVMAARTIPNRTERMLTIMVIPLMSCSARLPVYALLLAFLVPPGQPWLAGIGLGALYLFSLISGGLVAGITSKFKKTTEKSTFMLELPAYRKPVIKHIAKNTYYKSGMYIRKAGPTIVFISLILWALTYFPDINPEIERDMLSGLNETQITRLTESQRLNNSFAASLGNMFEPLLEPLGWDWRVGVSLISAFAAREVFVSALAITLNITDESAFGGEDKMQSSILSTMKEAKINHSGVPLFTTASVVALIIYFMFAMQCLSTVAVTRKETGSWKIPLLQIFIYTIMAYVLAFAAYNSLHLIGIS